MEELNALSHLQLIISSEVTIKHLMEIEHPHSLLIWKPAFVFVPNLVISSVIFSVKQWTVDGAGAVRRSIDPRRSVESIRVDPRRRIDPKRVTGKPLQFIKRTASIV